MEWKLNCSKTLLGFHTTNYPTVGAILFVERVENATLIIPQGLFYHRNESQHLGDFNANGAGER